MALKRKFTYDLREFQLKCLESLEALDEVCHAHNLKYYLIAGTLIGAMRHKGFIPWDDDIDIALSRKDYDTLMAHADEWFPERFHIVTHENDPLYPKFFAKLEDRSTTLVERFFLGYVGGVYIDIFPLDEVPNNKLLRVWHFKKFNFARKLLYFYYRDPYKHGKGVSSFLIRGFQKLFSRKGLHNFAQGIMREYEGHDNCDLLMTHDDGTCAYPKHSVGEPLKYEFEGKLFDGPADGTLFLSSYYGPDFMQLPPENKRISHYHEYCDLNNGYADADFDKLREQYEIKY